MLLDGVDDAYLTAVFEPVATSRRHRFSRPVALLYPLPAPPHPHRARRCPGFRPGGPLLAALCATLLLAACATNYPDPSGPRYGGSLPAAPAPVEKADTLLVVSFNVENGRAVDSALAVLTTTPEIRGADLILLQEMDAEGTRRMAEALGMAWVYYPAIERGATGRDFGNAILSRWPVVEDEKIVLPYLGVFNRSQRIATAATVRVGGRLVRAYSVHLATPVSLAWRYRRDQLRTVLEDAREHPRVIIGGDLNSRSLGEEALRHGFSWPTRDGPRTLVWGRWDHLFLRGLSIPGEVGSGTILDNRGSSDHLPVWVRAVPGL